MLTDLKLTQTKKIIQFFYFIKKKKEEMTHVNESGFKSFYSLHKNKNNTTPHQK